MAPGICTRDNSFHQVEAINWIGAGSKVKEISVNSKKFCESHAILLSNCSTADNNEIGLHAFHQNGREFSVIAEFGSVVFLNKFQTFAH